MIGDSWQHTEQKAHCVPLLTPGWCKSVSNTNSVCVCTISQHNTMFLVNLCITMNKYFDGFKKLGNYSVYKTHLQTVKAASSFSSSEEKASRHWTWTKSDAFHWIWLSYLIVIVVSLYICTFSTYAVKSNCFRHIDFTSYIKKKTPKHFLCTRLIYIICSQINFAHWSYSYFGN